MTFLFVSDDEYKPIARRRVGIVKAMPQMSDTLPDGSYPHEKLSIPRPDCVMDKSWMQHPDLHNPYYPDQHEKMGMTPDAIIPGTSAPVVDDDATTADVNKAIDQVLAEQMGEQMGDQMDHHNLAAGASDGLHRHSAGMDSVSVSLPPEDMRHPPRPNTMDSSNVRGIPYTGGVPPDMDPCGPRQFSDNTQQGSCNNLVDKTNPEHNMDGYIPAHNEPTNESYVPQQAGHREVGYMENQPYPSTFNPMLPHPGTTMQGQPTTEVPPCSGGPQLDPSICDPIKALERISNATVPNYKQHGMEMPYPKPSMDSPYAKHGVESPYMKHVDNSYPGTPNMSNPPSIPTYTTADNSMSHPHYPPSVSVPSNTYGATPDMSQYHSQAHPQSRPPDMMSHPPYEHTHHSVHPHTPQHDGSTIKPSMMSPHDGNNIHHPMMSPVATMDHRRNSTVSQDGRPDNIYDVPPSSNMSNIASVPSDPRFDVAPSSVSDQSRYDVTPSSIKDKTNHDGTPPGVPDQTHYNGEPHSVSDQTRYDVAPPSVPDHTRYDGAPPSVPDQTRYDGAPSSVPDQTRYDGAPPSIPDQTRYDGTPPSVPEQTQYDGAPPSVPDQTRYDVAPPSVPDQMRYDAAPPSVPDQIRYDAAPPSVPDQMRYDAAPHSVPDQTRYDVAPSSVPELSRYDTTGPGSVPNTTSVHSDGVGLDTNIPSTQRGDPGSTDSSEPPENLAPRSNNPVEPHIPISAPYQIPVGPTSHPERQSYPGFYPPPVTSSGMREAVPSHGPQFDNIMSQPPTTWQPDSRGIPEKEDDVKNEMKNSDTSLPPNEIQASVPSSSGLFGSSYPLPHESSAGTSVIGATPDAPNYMGYQDPLASRGLGSLQDHYRSSDYLRRGYPCSDFLNPGSQSSQSWMGGPYSGSLPQPPILPPSTDLSSLSKEPYSKDNYPTGPKDSYLYEQDYSKRVGSSYVPGREAMAMFNDPMTGHPYDPLAWGRYQQAAATNSSYSRLPSSSQKGYDDPYYRSLQATSPPDMLSRMGMSPLALDKYYPYPRDSMYRSPHNLMSAAAGSPFIPQTPNHPQSDYLTGSMYSQQYPFMGSGAHKLPQGMPVLPDRPMGSEYYGAAPAMSDRAMFYPHMMNRF